MRRILSVALSTVLAAACSSPSTSSHSALDSSVLPITTGNWYRPAPLVTWHWQLKGAINESYNVDVYDIDLFDVTSTEIQRLQASGKKVICYFSGGSYENWRTDIGRFDGRDLGKTLSGWPDERWLDIRSANVFSIMKDRLDLAKQKGCDGVESDNMDGYSNDSGFPLAVSDQLAFNRAIANEAHLRGLSVGLKNDVEQINDLVAYFDFAVNEQCFEFAECDMMTPFITNNKAVVNAEYGQLYVNDTAARSALCADSINRKFSTLILPLNLDDTFRFSCL